MAFAGANAWPVVLKVSRGGYDGRGVWVVDGPDEAESVMSGNPLAPGVEWLVEQYVPFTRELAAQVARSPSGPGRGVPGRAHGPDQRDLHRGGRPVPRA